MGNMAKYWYKSTSLILGEELENRLRQLGFVPVHEYQADPSKYEKVYDYHETARGIKLLTMIYAQESQIGDKGDFEDLMRDFKVPIQKWMEG